MTPLRGLEFLVCQRTPEFREQLQRCRDERNWVVYMLTFPRGTRWDVLAALRPELTLPEYWQVVADVWTDSESVWRQRRKLPRLLCPREAGFVQHRGCAHVGTEAERAVRAANIMSEADRAHFASLPEIVSVYRGAQPVNLKGWSWTLDLARAHWFANRWGQGGLVLHGTVRRSDIVAVSIDRQENEVVVDPRAVTVQRTEAVPATAAEGATP